ncbi:Putative protein-S-isoprenylcysteine methyltransferase [Brevundimonas diminuta]|jgi:protein-S-isoprenylcysteine O-methyltransferase Ste14|uniref:Isoprenylcysteine carboxylmethyltransferase family protein n=1 Tax=Brevundimonas diminuta TaxID=293 RepID=A0A246KMU3_BREDI|nr:MULTISPECIES: isoprenylcysteine carboxylmethyltransferase family protein [Brevundimonas]EKY24475.1 nickel-cobalt-cadmium resistance family protein [Brevundimonas diminuta 470-4]OJU52550.1 MAG: isoprenylcysteine carboxyl methyltransferase [Brevundimonas sp. 67-6]EGF94781.1 isoprenylcysteine carboxyl methyltransferase [Brevundimonas diminuta ATCC 11568]MBD3574529.1 isoprenylcysteine carboxylmethyltransferase family protein [Brevundimonas diminuta]MBD3832567.1 isoprenylcysteine carboxylmethylt
MNAPGRRSAAPIDLRSVQRWRKLFILVGLFALLAWTLMVKAEPRLEHAVEHLGLIAIMLCIIGRAWCSLYIGGRKKQEIVTSGPYSLCRNPLYVFSFIGAFGAGAMSGSLSVGLVFVLACWIVFRTVVGREERYLSETFGETYDAYRRRTPRFMPNPRLWRDEAELCIRPTFFVRTIQDGLFFLLAVPLFELLEAAQQFGWFGAVLQLP